jgi:hypothetical protein
VVVPGLKLGSLPPAPFALLCELERQPRRIVARAQQKPLRQHHYRAGARGVVVLEARSGQRTSEARSP